MPVTHTNRQDKEYFLHARKTKKGNNRYYFSRSDSPKEGAWLPEDIPEGYEIEEKPNGKVYLRLEEEDQFRPAELEAVRGGLEENSSLESYEYKIVARGDTITVHVIEQDIEELNGLLRVIGAPGSGSPEETARNFGNYSAMMRFTVEEHEELGRIWRVERYCLRGGEDDWLLLDGSEDLEVLVEEFVPHLGRESFFELI
jgi:hypothetical protein